MERVAWGLEDESIAREAERDAKVRADAAIKEARARYHRDLADGVCVGRYDLTQPPAYYDYSSARVRREAIAAQLESAPVAASDLDYIATRGMERRGNKALGVTTFRLQEAELKK
jgi:hypothetical protein